MIKFTPNNLRKITNQLLYNIMTKEPPIKTTYRPYFHNDKQLLLLAAAEEAYSQAASVLQPVLASFVGDEEYDGSTLERLGAGLHLLEEAMGAHNRYMDSIK
jgi:hypothetical protein